MRRSRLYQSCSAIEEEGSTIISFKLCTFSSFISIMVIQHICLHRPGRALWDIASSSSQISTQLAHEGGKVDSPMHRPPLSPRKYSWYSFLLAAESNPRPQCSRKVKSMKNFSDTIGNQSRDIPSCNAVPQPTAPLQALHIPKLTQQI